MSSNSTPKPESLENTVIKEQPSSNQTQNKENKNSEKIEDEKAQNDKKKAEQTEKEKLEKQKKIDDEQNQKDKQKLEQQQQQYDNQNDHKQLVQTFQQLFEKNPTSLEELTEFKKVISNKDNAEFINNKHHILKERVGKTFSFKHLQSALKVAPKKLIKDLEPQKNIKLRWVSDIQDFGSANQNYTILEKIIKDTKKELNPDNSILMLGGDVFYDLHMENSRYFKKEEMDLENLNFLSDKIKEQISKEKGVRKKQLLRKELFNAYTKAVDDLFSTLDSNLVRGIITGNNESWGFMQNSGGLSEEGAKNAFQHSLLYAGENISDGTTSLGRDFKLGGMTGFSLSYYEENRDHVLESEDKTVKNTEDKELILYDILKQKNPNLITLHGEPTFFFKGKKTWKNIEPDGLSKYLDEYSGKDPLYVLCGHQGTQGITRKKNSAGKDIILLNSNVTMVDGKARAMSFDLDISNGKVKDVGVNTYAFNDKGKVQKYNL